MSGCIFPACSTFDSDDWSSGPFPPTGLNPVTNPARNNAWSSPSETWTFVHGRCSFYSNLMHLINLITAIYRYFFRRRRKSETLCLVRGVVASNRKTTAVTTSTFCSRIRHFGLSSVNNHPLSNGRRKRGWPIGLATLWRPPLLIMNFTHQYLSHDYGLQCQWRLGPLSSPCSRLCLDFQCSPLPSSVAFVTAQNGLGYGHI